MDLINARDAMKELTMALIYLSRFSENNRFSDEKEYYAWKGYNFDILNELDKNDFIRQGNRPSKNKIGLYYVRRHIFCKRNSC